MIHNVKRLLDVQRCNVEWFLLLFGLIDTFTKNHSSIHRGCLFCKSFLQFRLSELKCRIMSVTQNMLNDLQYDGSNRYTTVVGGIGSITFFVDWSQYGFFKQVWNSPQSEDTIDHVYQHRDNFNGTEGKMFTHQAKWSMQLC